MHPCHSPHLAQCTSTASSRPSSNTSSLMQTEPALNQWHMPINAVMTAVIPSKHCQCPCKHFLGMQLLHATVRQTLACYTSNHLHSSLLACCAAAAAAAAALQLKRCAVQEAHGARAPAGQGAAGRGGEAAGGGRGSQVRWGGSCVCVCGGG